MTKRWRSEPVAPFRRVKREKLNRFRLRELKSKGGNNLYFFIEKQLNTFGHGPGGGIQSCNGCTEHGGQCSDGNDHIGRFPQVGSV